MVIARKLQQIDRKLPLLMSVLVLATVALFASAAYFQFADSLYSNAGQRLTSAATLVADLVSQSAPRWKTQVGGIANSPDVAGFLETGVGRPGALAAIERSNPTRQRGRWRTQLLSPDGRTVLDRAWHPADSWPRWAESVVARGKLARGDMATSPILLMDSIPVYQLLHPVYSAGAGAAGPGGLLGYVLDTRAMVEGTQAAIRGLIGDSVTMLLGQRNAGVWTDLEKEMPAPPASTPGSKPFTFNTSAYGAGIGFAADVKGTPWTIWLQQPRRLVLAPVHGFVLRTVPIGAAIALIGAFLVWLVSHRLARRIVILTEQAELIVPQDATGEQPADGSRDEMDRLSDAFERMSTRVAAHQDLEGKLRQAQKLEAIGRLAGGIAHDFNNILTVIRNYAEFVREELPPGSPLAPDVKQIVTATQRAAALTGQLLAFSRHQVLNPKVLDLNEVIRGTEHMLRRVVPSNIELVTTLDGDLGAVMADRGQMEQILLNLAINAADAMPEGGTLSIRTQDARLDETFSLPDAPVGPGRYAGIIVTDTGSGMDRDTMVRIFDPFFTTKPVGKGTGLGLATVQGIVTQSGGHIRVYSELGHGTTFKIYLPRVSGEVTGQHSIAELRDDTPVKETVLLVEDEAQTREVTRRIFAKRGYVVLEATDGADALRVAESHPGPIHLVVSDVMMPGIGGGELAERVRHVRPNAAFLLMSGYAGDELSRRNLANASLAFIEKPFTSASLLAAARAALESVARAA